MTVRVAAGAGTSWSAVDATVTADSLVVVERPRQGEDGEDGSDDTRAEHCTQEVPPGTGRHATTVLRCAQSSVNPAGVGSRTWPRESGGRWHRSWVRRIRGGSPTPGSRCSRSTRRRTSAASRSWASRGSSRSRAARTRRCTAGGRGRCASTRGTRRRRSPTSATSTCSRTARRGCRWRSTCRRSSGWTPTTRAPWVRWAAPGSRSTRSTTCAPRSTGSRSRRSPRR